MIRKIDFPRFKLDFSNIDSDLLGDIAESCAKGLADASLQQNKYTQVRMFYDDIEKLNEKAKTATDKEFTTQILPFFNMMHSKVAYAQGRDLVTKDFELFTNATITAVDSPKTLGICKTFWEAFMGFYKRYRPK